MVGCRPWKRTLKPVTPQFSTPPQPEFAAVAFLPVIMSEKRFLHAPVRMIGDREVGAGRPVYITGEIGINHNGELANAIALLNQAADAGCDAVKFQKRTPEEAK